MNKVSTKKYCLVCSFLSFKFILSKIYSVLKSIQFERLNNVLIIIYFTLNSPCCSHCLQKIATGKKIRAYFQRFCILLERTSSWKSTKMGRYWWWQCLGNFRLESQKDRTVHIVWSCTAKCILRMENRENSLTSSVSLFLNPSWNSSFHLPHEIHQSLFHIKFLNPSLTWNSSVPLIHEIP